MSPVPKIASWIISFVMFLFLFPADAREVHIAGDVSVYQDAPKLPKIPKAPKIPKKLPADSAVNTKLIKRILKMFQFTKNARAKERVRIISIIDQILADSLVVTARDIQMLNEELSKRENQHFDSLMAMLNALASHQQQLDSIVTTVSEKTEEPATGPAVPPVPGSDINALVDKMMPILQKKSDEEAAEKNMQEKLKVVRSLYGRSQVVDTLILPDSMGVRYQVHLTQKAWVGGIQPYWMEDKAISYNYNALSSFDFMGYVFDGNTGTISAAFQESQVKSPREARQAGCPLQLVFFDSKAANITALLEHRDAQLLFADSLARLMARTRATGVTFYFQAMPAHQQKAFTSFITLVSAFLKTFDKNYLVNVVIPAYDRYANYNLHELSGYVDYFLIDFTQAAGSIAAPLSPLNGNPLRSITGAVARYLQADIPSSRFVLLLSYYGAVWEKGTNGAADVFSRYVSYSDIRAQYPSDTSALFDETASTPFIEVKNKSGEVIEEIWYDDAASLSAKYDYVLSNGLGGVAIWTLGADNNYGELWDALVNKFMVTDTVRLDTVPLKPIPPVKLTFWQSVQKELKTYVQLFRDPCSVKLDSYVGDTYFKYISLFFLVLSIAAGVFFVYMVRREGQDWKYRKLLLMILILLILLLVLSTFMTFFLNKELPFLGITEAQGEVCHSVPLTNVLIIAGIGMVVGMGIMHFLLQPLLKKNDVP